MRASWLGLLLALGGCTLDFDEFAAATQEQDYEFVDANNNGGDGFKPADTGFVPPDMGDGGATDMAAGDDTDGDGVPDATDNCPETPNEDQTDTDGDGEGDACDADGDGDGVDDAVDNCPTTPNPIQADVDRDGAGDECDDDADGDGLDLAAEMMKGTDPTLGDTDGDGLPDGMDLCPLVPSRVGTDSDNDGAGDACDPDDDGDGVLDYMDNCPGTGNGDQADGDGDGVGDACGPDYDGDAVANEQDNCPYAFNPDQAVVPCQSAFAPLTYTREGLSVYRTDDGVVAGTGGGALVVAGEETRTWTNGNGLVGNRVTGATRDADGRTWLLTDRGVSILRGQFAFAARAGDLGGGPDGALRDIASTADAVYVATDAGLSVLAGGVWTTFGEPQLPSLDVRGLHVDGQGRVWVATAAGVVRIVDRQAQPPLGGLPAIGPFNAVTAAGDGGFWVFGEGGAARLNADDSVAGTFMGFNALGVAPAARGGWYFATPEGVRRLDVDGRLYDPGPGVLPAAEVRDLAGLADEPRWAATAGGIVSIAGYFSQLAIPDGMGASCVTTATRVGSALWIAAEAGLYRHTAADGYVQVQALPDGRVNAIREIGDRVWVATAGGIGVFAHDGSPDRQYAVGDEVADIPEAAVTDVVGGRNGQVWVATDGAGIARLDGENWSAFSTQNAGNNFVDDAVEALAHDGTRLWAATQLGLINFNEDSQTFENAVTGGQLPDPRVQDVVAGGGRVFAATPLGVGVRAENGSWSRLNRVNFGIPSNAGTDFARAIAYDGAHMWFALPAAQRAQELGSVVRRLVEGDFADLSFATLFNSESGLTPSTGPAGVNLEYKDGELFFSYCGDQESPGGLTVLDGGGVVTRDLSGLGLPSDEDGASLTTDHAGRPLFNANVRGGASGFSIGLDGAASSFFLPPDRPAPTRCDTPPDDPTLWCIIPGEGVARRVREDTWTVLSRNEIPVFGDADLRDIEVAGAATVWVASGAGVIHINMGNIRPFNSAGTRGGLPSDDVRGIAIAPDGTTVYAGTAEGLGIYDGATWTAVGRDALSSIDVRAVATDPTGSVWVGTADGLFRRDPGGAATEVDVRNGLPTNRVNAVAVHPDGRVFVGTDLGLAVGSGGEFTHYGFVDGLPGDAVWDVVVASDGEVWVRSDDGIARFAVDPPMMMP